MIEFKNACVESCMHSGIEYGLIWRNHGVDLVKDRAHSTATTFTAIASSMGTMGTFQ